MFENFFEVLRNLDEYLLPMADFIVDWASLLGVSQDTPLLDIPGNSGLGALDDPLDDLVIPDLDDIDVQPMGAEQPSTSSELDGIDAATIDWEDWTEDDVMPSAPLKCLPMSTSGRLPTRGTPGSAGLDLYSDQTIIIRAGTSAKIPTGICLAIPKNCFGQIADKSSVATKFGLHVIAGIIDFDYRGEIFVCLHNMSMKDVKINKGDQIAQLLIIKYKYVNPVWVKRLDKTHRKGGFGSTSKK